MPSPLLLLPPNLCAHFGAVKRLLFPGAEALMQTGFTKCCPQALCCCCHNNCRISDAKTVIDTCARVHCRLLPTLISILLWSTAWPHNGLQSFVFVHSDYWSVLMTSLCLKRTHTIDHTHTHSQLVVSVVSCQFTPHNYRKIIVAKIRSLLPENNEILKKLSLKMDEHTHFLDSSFIFCISFYRKL